MEGVKREAKNELSELVFGEREAQSTPGARLRIAYRWATDEEPTVASHYWYGLAVAGKRNGEPYVEGRRV
jgi:hypothetical protein